MAGVSRDMALRAFDHVAGLLLGAGTDGGVTRAQTQVLVDQLRREGRGTEAIAADSLFTMVDHIDHEKQQHVTGEHLDRAKAFFAKKLYYRGGPLSDAEIAQMSPTLRALLEIGQVISIPPQAGRVAHAIPRQGLEHVASLLRLLARPDGAILRADRDLMVYELYERGRGTEALAVRYFFNFIDHRSGQVVERITLSEIDDAVRYSDTHLLRNKDTDNNGYSADEIAKFSTTARAFLLVGQMIEAGLINPVH